MLMFSVTDVSTYLFCPRKLYLYRVLEFEEPPSELLVLGKINHLMFDQINKMDKDIVSSIQEFDPAKIREQYRKSYFKALKDILNLQKDVINGVNLKTINIFHDSWPRFLEESELRADNVVSFIKNNNIFGKELWEKLTPKYLTEVKLQSEKLMLRGIVDRIEINEEMLFLMKSRQEILQKKEYGLATKYSSLHICY